MTAPSGSPAAATVGTPVSGAASSVSPTRGAGSTLLRQREPAAPPLPTGSASTGGELRLQAMLHDTARRLLRAGDAGDAAAALVDLVTGLGGRVVAAVDAPDHALPLDLAMGSGAPLLPVADDPVAHLVLERHLPGLAADARRQLDLLRAARGG
jgi:hypothetical protein